MPHQRNVAGKAEPVECTVAPSDLLNVVSRQSVVCDDPGLVSGWIKQAPPLVPG